MIRRRLSRVFVRGLMLLAIPLLMAALPVPPACAQGTGGWFGGLMNRNGNRGFYPYPGTNVGGSAGQGNGYNIYGNYGVYGYPGSGIEGGASNSGYDPGYGGYPSYGGYGISNIANRNLPASGSAPLQRLLGIDEDPIVAADGVKAMKVGKVYPDTPAERAGLAAGDVILSINGYLTEQRGNLAWIIANAPPSNELKISIRAAKDGKDRVLTAKLQ